MWVYIKKIVQLRVIKYNSEGKKDWYVLSMYLTYTLAILRRKLQLQDKNSELQEKNLNCEFISSISEFISEFS